MTRQLNRSWHDSVIERGLAALVVFAPVAFASVPVWASSIVDTVAFGLFGVWLHRETGRRETTLEAGPVLALAVLLVVLALVQLVPLPEGALALLSPTAARIRIDAGVVQPGSWHPISLNPQETLDGLVGLLACLAVFVVVSSHFRSRRRSDLLVRTIIFTACSLVVVAVLQKAAWNGRLYWFYPIDPLYEKRLQYVWGPYLNRNHFAGLLEMAAPLALGRVIYRLSRIHSTERSLSGRLMTVAGHGRLPELTIYFLAFLLLSGALFATLSRGGILGYAASMAFLGAVMRSRRQFRKWTGSIALAGIAVAMVGLFATWDRIEERFMDLTREDRVARMQVWSDIGIMVKDFPAFGSGLGTFDRVYPRYQAKYSTIRFEHAENDYLEVLTDMGVPGFLLVLGATGIYYVVAFRRWRARKNAYVVSTGAAGLAACIALSVHSMTDFNIRVPANALLLTVISALAIAVITGAERRRSLHLSVAAGLPASRSVVNEE